MLQPIILDELSRQEYAIPNDSDRNRSWLKPAYSSMRWKVYSEKPAPGEVPVSVKFNLSVRDGKLADYPELMKAAKEYVFWNRELSNGGAAATALERANAFLKFCVYLANMGISSFSQLTSAVYTDAINAWAEGGEQLMDTEVTILTLTSQFLVAGEVPPKFLRQYSRARLGLNRTAILAECGLTSSGRMSKMVFDSEDRRLGFTVSLSNQANSSAPSDLEDFDEDDEDDDDVLTKQVILKRQSAFWFMYENRGVLCCQNFTFDPSRHVIYRGKEPENTPVPPPDLCFDLHAAAYAVTSTQADRLSAKRKQLAKSPPPNARNARSAGFQWTEAALRYALCTWVQTALMTVRRPMELRLMQRDCLHGDGKHGWYVKVYIVKNRKEWVFIPVPTSVVEAIKGLIALSPDEPMTGPLFVVRNPVTGILKRLSPKTALPAFAAEVNAVNYVAENDVQAKWHWVPRQLRRYTAHLHFWGYGGSVAVISHILNHFSLSETSVYTKLDKGTRRAWNRVKEEFQRHIAKQAINGELGGAAGKALTRDAKRLEASIRRRVPNMLVIDPDQLVDGMAEVIRRKMLVLVPKAWVICSCPNTKGAARRAMCRKQPGAATPRAIGPDFRRAGAHVCKGGCIWAIENDVTRQFAAKELENLQLSCATLEGTVLGDMQKAGVVNFLKVESAIATTAAQSSARGRSEGQ